MTPRKLTETYSVSPQISPEDVAALRDAGFVMVLCNRPDEENPPALQSDAMRQAVEAEGLRFAVLPLTHQTMNAENILKQQEIVASAGGPVLAYCASGTRCTVIWALGNAQTLGADAVIGTALEAGYDISGLRPTLETLAQA
ncbi:TIGR01244 family sulfur transferase [Sagittula sp. S175]|uniref:TIGR01244 family sulfur transferase n=1 Tax=Sagittula sp. S175 TaxID=3415129 RepID=UPI003C7B35A6